MKKWITVFLFIVPMLTHAQRKEEAYRMTQQIIASFMAGSFDSIRVHFDSSLTRNLTTENMKDVWDDMNEQFGGQVEFGQTTIDSIIGFTISQTPVKLARGKMVLNLAIDKNMKVAGIHFVPKAAYDPPPYVNTLSFLESRLQFGTLPYILEGTLTVPAKAEKKLPCVIIIGGSGPTDRDGTYGDNKAYKDLAWALASKGIAVFRFDKRTSSHGAMIATEEYNGKKLTVREEYLDDVKAAFARVSKHAKVDASRIYLLGHSQGGMLGPWFMQENKKAAGLIMMAGNARHMAVLLGEQLDHIYEGREISDATRKQVDAMKRHAVFAASPDLKADFPADSLPGASAAYWVSLSRYDQVAAARALTKPLLILQGERDYQVTMKEFNIWKEQLAGKPGVTFKSYPKLNHFFMEGEGRSTPEEYNVRSNVPEYVANDIAAWINGLKR